MCFLFKKSLLEILVKDLDASDCSLEFYRGYYLCLSEPDNWSSPENSCLGSHCPYIISESCYGYAVLYWLLFLPVRGFLSEYLVLIVSFFFYPITIYGLPVYGLFLVWILRNDEPYRPIFYSFWLMEEATVMYLFKVL